MTRIRGLHRSVISLIALTMVITGTAGCSVLDGVTGIGGAGSSQESAEEQSVASSMSAADLLLPAGDAIPGLESTWTLSEDAQTQDTSAVENGLISDVYPAPNSYIEQYGDECSSALSAIPSTLDAIDVASETFRDPAVGHGSIAIIRVESARSAEAYMDALIAAIPVCAQGSGNSDSYPFETYETYDPADVISWSVIDASSGDYVYAAVRDRDLIVWAWSDVSEGVNDALISAQLDRLDSLE